MAESSRIASKLVVEGFVFPPAVRPPGSSSALFLGGAGIRGLDIGGKFITFTAIGVYLQEEAIHSLSGKWKGKTVDELAASPNFFHDIFTGNFEKFTRVTMILPLTGHQYSEKVVENCIAYLKTIGAYAEAEATAGEKFKEVFKEETFSHGDSILFTHSPSGSLTIAFSKDGSLLETGFAVIENKALSEAVLESIIGENGVSPSTKQSLAFHMSELLDESHISKEILEEKPISAIV